RSTRHVRPRHTPRWPAWRWRGNRPGSLGLLVSSAVLLLVCFQAYRAITFDHQHAFVAASGVFRHVVPAFPQALDGDPLLHNARASGPGDDRIAAAARDSEDGQVARAALEVITALQRAYYRAHGMTPFPRLTPS